MEGREGVDGGAVQCAAGLAAAVGTVAEDGVDWGRVEGEGYGGAEAGAAVGRRGGGVGHFSFSVLTLECWIEGGGMFEKWGWCGRWDFLKDAANGVSVMYFWVVERYISPFQPRDDLLPREKGRKLLTSVEAFGDWGV